LLRGDEGGPVPLLSYIENSKIYVASIIDIFRVLANGKRSVRQKIM
jgi:hypothetical protein